MFLRETRAVPPVGAGDDRWPGVAVLGRGLALALLGNLVQIDDLVFYALIVWIFGLILVGFGWRRGLVFWPSVLHLVFMLPLPQFLYWKVNTTLQFLSSEIGVSVLRLMAVPVFLEGNVIDLGVMKLMVAEACSGLRYLFPIMSFSYVFAVLYRGPVWHKLSLLLAAVPLAILMNALRIGAIGLLVDRYGIAPGRGLPACLRGLGGVSDLHRAPVPAGDGAAAADGRPALLGRGDRPRLLRPARPARPGARHPRLGRADRGRAPHRRALRRLGLRARRARPSRIAARPLQPLPARDRRLVGQPRRCSSPGSSGSSAPTTISPRSTATRPRRSRSTCSSPTMPARPTAARSIRPRSACPAPAGRCSRSSRLTVDLPGTGFGSVTLNRVVIQKGLEKQLVYYWFEGRGRRVTNDFAAKFYTVADSMRRGRTDGGLVRVITPDRRGRRGRGRWPPGSASSPPPLTGCPVSCPNNGGAASRDAAPRPTGSRMS